MSEIIRYILSIDPSLLFPIIIIVLALVMKMKFKDAIMSGLILAIAFTSVNLVIGFMFDTISPVAIQFVKNTNIELNIIDLGFSPMVAISFAWNFAIIMFPLQILLNMILIHFNITNVLNVDIFNIWTKIFTAAIIYIFTESVILGFIAAIIQIIFELKISEITQKRVENLTRIKGTVCSHASIIQVISMYPINNFLDRFKFIKENKMNFENIKNKIGIFGEDSVMGSIIGFLLSISAGYTFIDSLDIAIKLATTLVLLPICSKLFIKALNPISESAKKFMQSKYENRDIHIGFDWPILSGIQELWIVSVILIPITLILAIVFSKLGLSNILPLPGIVNIVVVIPALIVSNKNVLKMLILCTIFTPVYLIVSSQFAPAITELAKDINHLNIQSGQLISYYSLESPLFRWIITKCTEFNIYGIIGLTLFILAYYNFKNNFNKEA